MNKKSTTIKLASICLVIFGMLVGKIIVTSADIKQAEKQKISNQVSGLQTQVEGLSEKVIELELELAIERNRVDELETELGY